MLSLCIWNLQRLQLCLWTWFLGIGGKTTTKTASEGVKGAQILVLGSKMVKMSNFTHSYDVICQNLGRLGRKKFFQNTLIFVLNNLYYKLFG